MSRDFLLSIAGIAMSFAFAACGGDSSAYPSPTPRASFATTTAAIQPTSPSSLVLGSDAFRNNGEIPARYSCSGDSISPALSWTGAPAGTTEFILVAHDPDAPLRGGFTHWVITGIPPSTTSLPPGVPAGDTIPEGGTQLVSYRGMCPPVGSTAHHYHFHLYALSSPPDVDPLPTKEGIEEVIQGHLLAETDLVGTFGR